MQRPRGGNGRGIPEKAKGLIAVGERSQTDGEEPE